MSKFKIQLVELTPLSKTLPLTSGYLQAYACKDAVTKQTYQFSLMSKILKIPREELLSELLDSDASIYAFSCYVWNMGVIRFLIRELRRLRPSVKILLGGPQVVQHGELYIDASEENVYVCNGEGEKTFAEFLKINYRDGDFSEVPGLTFRRGGNLVTTPAPSPLDLNEIPSPFLNGCFQENHYLMSVFETNRGCPYHCTFCYWGKGDDLSVRKFDETRIAEELEWLSKKGVPYIHSGDANWGMLKRDLEFTRKIVDCKKKFDAPMIFNFAAAKSEVGIRRSAAIAEMLAEGEILTSQLIGVQSVTEQVLKNVKRLNVKDSVLDDVRLKLESKGVSTAVELIWPLPGETLVSFKDSVTHLCEREVTNILVYPSLLLKTTPMENQQEQYELRTQATLNEEDEMELIISTSTVSEREYEDGMWIVFGLHSLYNCRTLYNLARHLHKNRIVSYGDFFEKFGVFARNSDEPLQSLTHWRETLAVYGQAEHTFSGKLAHLILHEERGDFEKFIRSFAEDQGWLQSAVGLFFFEMDRINCPYIYSNTPLTISRSHEFLKVQAIETAKRQIRVLIAGAERSAFEAPKVSLRESETLFQQKGQYKVNYKQEQFPFRPSNTEDANAVYCHGMLQRSIAISPIWEAVK